MPGDFTVDEEANYPNLRMFSVILIVCGLNEFW
jgi:hypothetical protein